MPSNRIELPPIHSAEVVTLTFSFLSQLQPSEAITSQTPSVVVYSGGETVPALSIGSPGFSAGTTFFQVSLGTPGVIYELTTLATTNQLNKYVQRALLAILPNPE